MTNHLTGGPPVVPHTITLHTRVLNLHKKSPSSLKIAGTLQQTPIVRVVTKTHTARFEGKASSRSFERSGCDEALAVGKPHLVSPHVPCLLDAPRDVALMGVVVGCPVEKKIAPAYCGECRSLRQGCMPRTRDSEQAGCPLIAATGSGRRDVFIRSNRSAR